MRVAIDAYPLFGPRTGVGTYVHHLVAALVDLPEAPEVILPTASLRASGRAPAIPGTTSHHVRLPFRVLQGLWDRGRFPPAEWVIGSAEVFHATNFVAPPLRHTPLVTTIHDLSHERFPDTVDARVARYRTWVPDAIRRSARLITHAAATADDIAEFYGFDRARIAAIHLGVDPSWAAAAPADGDWLDRCGLPRRYLLFVGSPTDRKNIDLLLHAHATARAADDAVPPLVLAGPGPSGEGAADANPTTDVVSSGYLQDAQLRRLVAGATALVFPSRYEGFGLPVLEALATGTFVVASDLPVHREIAGGHAHLVDLEAAEPGERVERLREALITAAHQTSTPEVVAARRAWTAGFTWERTAAATLAVYEAAG
jgi:glycosyltransferase involved in cell wall biosynthesis